VAAQRSAVGYYHTDPFKVLSSTRWTVQLGWLVLATIYLLASSIMHLACAAQLVN
jgi:hypothetical protein